MILGERSHGGSALHVPPWSFTPDDNSYPVSPNTVDDYTLVTAALQRYLPSNTWENDAVSGFLIPEADSDKINGSDDFVSVDAHSCDHFRMYEFKIRKCTRGRSHDWTECPFAHPGEKARRRDLTKFHYSGTACPEFRHGSCRKGDACESAHGIFECWLHPARYRTQPCKDGMNCKRRVCFFAHSPDQLRVPSPRADFYDGPPNRVAFMSSPDSISPPVGSPPMSPMTSPTVNEMMSSLRQLQLCKMKSMPNSWVGGGLSPRVAMPRSGLFSLPDTPTPGIGYFDSWDTASSEEEPVMERVESGSALRAKMFEKLSKENPLDRIEPVPSSKPNPDVGCVGAGEVG